VTSIHGREVGITHPDKVLFPGDGITKRHLVEYYERVAEVMLPHVRDRPMSQHSFPQGIKGPGFWSKRIPGHFPDWIDRVKVETTDKGPQEQVVCNDPATLAYLASQNCITPHTFLSCADDLQHPDLMVFDLDPPGDDFRPVREGARTLRRILEELGLTPFVKTTGSKGVHVAVPLDRGATFDQVRAFAAAAGHLLTERDERFTFEVRKVKRRGRVFVDIGRNAYGQTAVPPYAVRARPGAPVATPVEWDELGRVTPARYTIGNMFRRLARREDPWRHIERQARPLPDPPS
jgi:bifunctional non-homologous end joining protein LigD